MKNAEGGSLDFVKPQIKVYDSNFAHAASCSNGDLGIKPQYFDWYRGSETKDIEIFVDGQYTQVNSSKARIKIWMLLEPPSVSGDLYRLARTDISKFDYVLTFDKTLLPLYYPNGGCWIKPEERRTYQKTKDISIIASGKNQTTGHILRHEIIQRTKGMVDVYGGGYRFIPNKLEALKDYRFSIIIENCQVNGYFTEKLIDCMVTGTIPIYWGSSSINNEFNHLGLLTFNTADEFISLISTVKYSDMFENAYHAIQENFIKAQKFSNTEDWIWLNFLKNLCTTIPKT